MRDAETSDLSDFVNKYNNMLKSLLDTYAPLRTKTIILRPTASWYNDEIRSEKRRRRALESRWRSSKLECDRLRFQEQSRKVNNFIKATKMEFYSGIIRDCSNSQTLFNTVSKLLHRNTPVDYPSTCESNTDLANRFIDFFGDKIAVIRNALDEVFDSISDFDDNVSFSDQFTLSSFRSVTSSDISQLIGRSTIKSCPLDPVPASVLKQCISVLLPVMIRIINQSICSAVVPESFKLALLNPLLKKPHLDSEVFANFRPISNLTFFSKLTERVVAFQLIEHVTNNCLDEIMQSAYKEFHSTETALVKVFNDIAIDIDRNRAIILLLLDLSAAFDTFDHSILLNRLAHRFGLRGSALPWFRSYLSIGTQGIEREIQLGIISIKKKTHVASPHNIPEWRDIK